jgi:RNA polymerase sigma-B factor
VSTLIRSASPRATSRVAAQPHHCHAPAPAYSPAPDGPSTATPQDLVHGHLALAEALAERWSSRRIDRLDLRQVAYLGLVQAARRFDQSRGVFAAFAASYIRGELMHYLRDGSRTIRTPRAVVEAAGANGVPSPLSLDASIAMDGESVPLWSTLGDFDRRLDATDARVPLFDALRSLPEQARLNIYLRYFEDLTQDEIAHRTGSTQKAVSRSIAASLRVLRQELSDVPLHLPVQRTGRR